MVSFVFYSELALVSRGRVSGGGSNRMTVAASAGNWELANSLFQNVLLIQSDNRRIDAG
jgi:hypothetical protein